MAAGPAGATQDEARAHNVSTLLRYVHEHGPTSRAELTSAMRLNRSTIGKLAADLAGVGLVREELPARTAGSGAGRPSLVVWPQPEQVYVLAFDIGVDYLIAARVGLGGSILDRRELFRPRGDYALDDVVTHLSRFTGEMSARVEPGSVCVGVGAAVAGAVRESDGMVRFAPNLGWVDEPLGTARARPCRPWSPPPRAATCGPWRRCGTWRVAGGRRRQPGQHLQPRGRDPRRPAARPVPGGRAAAAHGADTSGLSAAISMPPITEKPNAI